MNLSEGDCGVNDAVGGQGSSRFVVMAWRASPLPPGRHELYRGHAGIKIANIPPYRPGEPAVTDRARQMPAPDPISVQPPPLPDGPLFAALHRSPQAMVVVHAAPGLPIVSANAAFSQLTGYTVEQTLGRHYAFLQGTLTEEAHAQALAAAVEHGSEASVDILNYRENGSLFWNRTVVAGIGDGAAGTPYLLLLQSDVTGAHHVTVATDGDGTRHPDVHAAPNAQIIGEWNWDLLHERIYTDDSYAAYFSIDKGLAFTGVPAEAFVSAVHLDDRDRMLADVTSALQAGETFYTEFRTTKQGELRWIGSQGQPQRDSDGVVRRMAGLSWDLTEQKLAQQALRSHGARIDALIKQAAVGILQVDQQGRIEMTNDRYAELVGHSPPGLIGRSMFDFLDPGDLPHAFDVLATLFKAGEPVFLESRYPRSDGSFVWVSSHLSLLSSRGSGSRSASIVVIDISARKNAEQRQSALLSLGDRLRNLTDTASMTRIAARTVCDVGHWTRAGLGVVDATESLVTVERDWTAGPSRVSIAGEHRLSDYGEFFVDLRQGNTVVIPDVRHDPRTAASAGRLQAIDIGALLNVPLMEHGKLVALLFVHNVSPHAWRDDDVRFAQTVADRTWAAIKRGSADMAIKQLNETLEERVRQRTADLDRMWRLSTDIMLVTGFDLRVAALNPAWKVSLGWDSDELAGSYFPDLLHSDDQADTLAAMSRLSKGLATLQFENRCRHHDGGYRWFSWRAAADDLGIHAVGRDITAEKEAALVLRNTEAQLRQAQKMEAVGQLTGGIAHDFNNILQGVIGPLDLIRRNIQRGKVDNLGRFIDTATTSAKRAAALTHRLLAFSRRQALDPRPVDLNALVLSLEDLLRRTIGEDITLVTGLAPQLWTALTDANQLENALLNLVINARDAMPDGGGLAISTRNQYVDELYAGPFSGLRCGDYVVLSVVDTGVGMTADVIAKAFDPFFTTKPIGQGTGLGLSMIYGFAKQSNGHVYIHSEPGVGTRVELYLPRGAPHDLPAACLETRDPHVHTGDGETVLVVEDDPAVRLVVVEVLAGLAYRTLQAENGAQALEIIRSPQRLDLMVSDVGMPHMNGRDLAAISRSIRPGLKVLFMTGYAGGATEHAGFLDRGMDMIAKPFAVDALARKVRDMLAMPGP